MASPNGGVPFDFELRLAGDNLRVELPEAEVLAEDLQAAVDCFLPKGIPRKMNGKSCDVLSILQLAPSLIEEGSRCLKVENMSGLAQGTLIKVRVVESIPSTVVDEIEKVCKTQIVTTKRGKLAMFDAPATNVLDGVISNVDTIKGICYSAIEGIKCDSTMLDVTVPYALPATHRVPSPKQHSIYIIVDSSGSSASGNAANGKSGSNYLESSKTVLEGILRDLPAHVFALRKALVVNDLPITLH
eukprot:12539296-Ditylum_brightwellii.AAC.1